MVKAAGSDKSTSLHYCNIVNRHKKIYSTCQTFL